MRRVKWWTRNHSRAGGTETLRAMLRHGPWESLPRGRDGGTPHPPGSRRAGITPARAGRSARSLCRTPRRRNHSRAGGTERSGSAGRWAGGESLPRGRDGAHRPRGRDDARGITPARAGRRPCAAPARRSFRNHSRAGGTETSSSSTSTASRESLPRGRDGVPGPGRPPHIAGITPARAGRRWSTMRAWSTGGNHSRAGGTERPRSRRPPRGLESLPRGRDGGGTVRPRTRCAGITPARAGRSASPCPSRTGAWNHSRAGGTEHQPEAPIRVYLESLPRGRDGVFHAALPDRGGGITPARAGRSPSGSASSAGHGNHSRAGGTERLSSSFSPRAT